MSYGNGNLAPGLDLDALVDSIADRAADIVLGKLLEHIDAAQDDKWLNTTDAARAS